MQTSSQPRHVPTSHHHVSPSSTTNHIISQSTAVVVLQSLQLYTTPNVSCNRTSSTTVAVLAMKGGFLHYWGYNLHWPTMELNFNQSTQHGLPPLRGQQYAIMTFSGSPCTEICFFCTSRQIYCHKGQITKQLLWFSKHTLPTRALKGTRTMYEKRNVRIRQTVRL